jgi:hypothetical protein
MDRAQGEGNTMQLPARPQFGRRDLFHAALIDAHQHPRLSCFVRDLTSEGARVMVTTGLPAHFRLIVATKGVNVDCETVDKGEGYVDVRFL